MTWPLYLYVCTCSYNMRQSALKCRSCNILLYCDSRHVCQGFFTMNLEQCIAKKIFKMKCVVQLVRKCWNLEMTKEKFRCYLSCFLRHRNSMHSHMDMHTIMCVEFSFGFSKNNKLQHIPVDKKMVNDYLNLELTNMVTILSMLPN